jgi:hypothetical protein
MIAEIEVSQLMLNCVSMLLAIDSISLLVCHKRSVTDRFVVIVIIVIIITIIINNIILVLNVLFCFFRYCIEKKMDITHYDSALTPFV